MTTQTTTPRNQTGYKTLDVLNADERIATAFKDDDGIWIWLVTGNGWTGDAYGAHDIHEDTVKAALAAYKRIVKCDCKDCTIERARIESSNGYVQHVNITAAGNYIISDWCDGSTVASFENGRAL